MSSNDDKSDGGSQNKLDIDAFRHHLLNYRSKVDESALDLTYELDSSFKRMLDEKRQMTNKENNPPSVEESAASVNPPEKPLRKDLLKDRLRSRVQDDSLQTSYVLENSIGTDMDFSTINRLLADFNLNRDSSMPQKRSPLKILKITDDFLSEAGPFNQHLRNDGASERAFNANHSRVQALNDIPGASPTTNADDTLEEIEYVLDRGLNYVPKRLINELKLKPVKNEFETVENDVKDTSFENDENQENDENNQFKTLNDEDVVIVVDSSPENSFGTTQATERYKSAFESIENTFYTAKSNPSNLSILSIDSDSTNDDSTRSINQLDSKLNEKPCNLPIPDQSADGSFEMSKNPHNDTSSANESGGEMPQFNNTLERVEYMMEQGAKILHERNNKVQEIHVQTKKTPVSQSKVKIQTPNSLPTKKIAPKHLTPNKGDLFKRPDQRDVRSPFSSKAASASKVMPPPIKSRIPTKTGSLHKPQFRHIASPIAAYINNTPEIPLMKTIKPMRNLMNEDFSKMCKRSAELNESTQSVESFPLKSSLPCKMYISAQQRKIIDQRHVVTPGGKSVKRLIGNQPLVIRHDGKEKSHNHAESAAPQFEESLSLSELSMASGDISVQVVQDVHRQNHA